MKKFIIIIAIFFNIDFASGQEVIGLIAPGQKFQNPYNFNLFFMPRDKVIEFKNLATKSEFDALKISLYQEQLKTYEERIFLADSSSQLKKLEADFWHEKLIANDGLLEAERKVTVQLRADVEQAKRSRIYYFVGGVLTTSIAVGLLK